MHDGNSNSDSKHGNEPEELDSAALDEVNGGAKLQRLEHTGKPARPAEFNKSSAREYGTKKNIGKIILFDETETI